MLDFGFYNMDCMDGMKQFPDKYFNLAIVDPPYGIPNAFNKGKRLAKYGDGRSVNDWKPTEKYFDELFRVSKNQIIWGCNHLSDMLPTTREFIFWYKHNAAPSFSDGELAWTSFSKTAKCFDYPFFGSIGAEENKCHPTQKPVRLYEWLLQNYAKTGDKILDTHVGSASSLIACHRMHFDYVGFEINKDFYEAANARLQAEIAQISLF